MDMITIVIGSVFVFLGIVLWGAGLLLPGGVFHNPVYMVVGMIFLTLGGAVAGVPRSNNIRVRTR